MFNHLLLYIYVYLFFFFFLRSKIDNSLIQSRINKSLINSPVLKKENKIQKSITQQKTTFN